MPVWPILPLTLLAAAVLRRLRSRYQLVEYCSQEHRFDQVVLQHHAKVPCDITLWIAQLAQETWKDLRAEFSEETREEFRLDVVWSPYSNLGWRVSNESRAVVNLAVPDSMSAERMGFEARKQALRGTISEELHHVVRFRRMGEEPYLFRPEDGDGHIGMVLYYAINDFEYEALKFCVRTTGDRAALLDEVVEYRRNTGREV